MKSEKVKYLVASLTLGDPFSANLDPGLAEDLDHLEGVDAESGCKKHLDSQPPGKRDYGHLPAALPGKVSGPMSSHSAWSSRPFVLNSTPPQVITPAVNLNFTSVQQHLTNILFDLHVAIKLFLV